jgi:hypothetical protein
VVQTPVIRNALTIILIMIDKREFDARGSAEQLKH